MKYSKSYINELENYQKWNEVKCSLEHLWLTHKDNIEIASHLGCICWYVLVFWERIDNSTLDERDFIKTLTEVTEYGLISFTDKPEFLWKFGYMIKLFPYYFGDYEKWEKIGQQLIEKAHELKPEDPVITMIYLNDDSLSEYKEACVKVSEQLPSRFSGTGVIDKYFRSVLNHIDKSNLS